MSRSQKPNSASHFKAAANPKTRKPWHVPAPALVVGGVLVLALVVLACALLPVAAPLRAALGFGSPQAASTASSTQAASTAAASTQAASSASAAATNAASTAAAREAATQAATPEPAEDTTPLNTSANAELETTTHEGIEVNAPKGFIGTPSMQHLVDVVQEVRNSGTELGFMVEDLNTGRRLAYNANSSFYPASSIKAAYCAMVFETQGGSAGMSDVLQNCIVNSSNDAFHTLINSFGLSSYANWLSEHGAPTAGESARVYYYPHISPTEMANLWKEMYRFGNSNEGGAKEFASYVAQSNHSAMGGLLRDRYEVWSKPGWYPADGSGLSATVDCGVVFSDAGPYVYAVFSNASEDFDQLMPVLDALNAAHGKMCGGSSALRQTASTTLYGS